MQFVDWEEGGGNRRTFKHFNNKINKHKKKQQPLTDDCHTQNKIQAWSSLLL